MPVDLHWVAHIPPRTQPMEEKLQEWQPEKGEASTGLLRGGVTTFDIIMNEVVVQCGDQQWTSRKR